MTLHEAIEISRRNEEAENFIGKFLRDHLIYTNLINLLRIEFNWNVASEGNWGFDYIDANGDVVCSYYYWQENNEFIIPGIVFVDMEQAFYIIRQRISAEQEVAERKKQEEKIKQEKHRDEEEYKTYLRVKSKLKAEYDNFVGNIETM